MTTPACKISGKAILTDIRAGANNNALMKKHRLSGEQLKRVLKKLLDAGGLDRSEYDRRVPPDPKKLTPVFTCAACGATTARRFIKCPSCGVKVPSFRYESPDSGSGEVCWFCAKVPPSQQAVLTKVLIADYKAHPNGRITFHNTSVDIPRCSFCQAKQEQAKDLKEALRKIDAQIQGMHNEPVGRVPQQYARPGPVTVTGGVAAGLVGLWLGLQMARMLGMKNVWLQAGLGFAVGMLLFFLVMVSIDSSLLARLRRIPRADRTSASTHSAPPESHGGRLDGENPPGALESLLRRRDTLQEQRSLLLAQTRPEAAWVEFPEVRALLETGWDYDLNRPGLSALKLVMEVEILSHATRTRNKGGK